MQYVYTKYQEDEEEDFTIFRYSKSTYKRLLGNSSYTWFKFEEFKNGKWISNTCSIILEGKKLYQKRKHRNL